MAELRSAVEERALAFYEWEVQGRGLHLAPRPIRLEPPFRRFERPRRLETARTDDARRSTWLSSLWESFFNAEEDPPLAEADPSPIESEADDSPHEIVEYELSFGTANKFPKGASHAWLQSLSECAWPVSFELLGCGNEVRMVVAVREPDALLVRGALQSYFPDLSVLDVEERLSSTWGDEDGIRAVLEFGLGREFMLPLREPAPEPDSLVPLVSALSSAREGEVAAPSTPLRADSTAVGREHRPSCHHAPRRAFLR